MAQGTGDGLHNNFDPFFGVRAKTPNILTTTAKKVSNRIRSLSGKSNEEREEGIEKTSAERGSEHLGIKPKNSDFRPIEPANKNRAEFFLDPEPNMNLLDIGAGNDSIFINPNPSNNETIGRFVQDALSTNNI